MNSFVSNVMTYDIHVHLVVPAKPQISLLQVVGALLPWHPLLVWRTMHFHSLLINKFKFSYSIKHANYCFWWNLLPLHLASSAPEMHRISHLQLSGHVLIVSPTTDNLVNMPVSTPIPNIALKEYHSMMLSYNLWAIDQNPLRTHIGTLLSLVS